ncbi:hypothetical protein KO481_40810 [Nocardia sp. NEAU-G5]|uniref:Uncharacterized protein n=1 Tax=Nocardia albiluteola TaxID=2842303 RepID=A0ABS6BF34_9NOCA|nr:hypothetical protein [Nocardia albiluteola]MBU3067843.1 hypothetical protein [Nocardia albiluteola]
MRGNWASAKTISVLKPKTPAVYCKSIQIKVPKNDADGNPYFAEEPEWSYSSANWEPSNIADPGDEGEDSGAQYWRKIFTPLEAGKPFDSQFDIGLKGAVSNTGPLACEVIEVRQPAPPRNPYSENARSLSVSSRKPSTSTISSHSDTAAQRYRKPRSNPTIPSDSPGKATAPTS